MMGKHVEWPAWSVEQCQTEILRLQEALEIIAAWQEGRCTTAGLGVGSLAPGHLHLKAMAKAALEGNIYRG